MSRKKPEDETSDKLLFLRQFLARPGEVASIMPSSLSLVRQLIADTGPLDVKTVLEYGPGTGAITRQLLNTLPAGTRYLAAEPNDAFRQHLTGQGLQIEIIPDYAQNVAERVLETAGEIDLVVSGLPCSVIPPAVMESIFDSTFRILRPGGEFRQFIYTHTLIMPKMQGMMTSLRRRFSKVQTINVWRNFPPATIIRCVK